MRDFLRLLEAAGTLADIFEVVKRAVLEFKGITRGGLMLALADLGNRPNGFFGGFFQVGSNIIVMNKIPLARIKETRHDLYKPYAFHVLLHEYLHTLGYLDEELVRKLVLDISEKAFSRDHVTTRCPVPLPRWIRSIARNTSGFFPNLVYPNISWQPADLKLELVEDFDRSSVGYIA